MSAHGSVASHSLKWTLTLQLAACLLCSLPVSHGQEASASAAHIKSIPLQKQYVPVMKDDKILAYKTAYFAEIAVGNPAQTFTVVFDTGSGHVILPRSTCNTETCAKHRRFNSDTSSSAVDIKHDGTPLDPQEARDHVVISFGTGKVTGIFVQDDVCIGVSEPECVKLRVVTALEMTPDPFGHFAFDGVFGLGLDALRLDPKFSFFGEMVSQHPQMLPQFSVFLSHFEDDQSSITFGGHDTTRASTDIEWAPVTMAEMGYWLVQIKQVRIGDTVLEDCADGSCRAILDTGTSLLGVPRESSRSMHRSLARPAVADGAESSEVDCRQVPGQTIHFDLEGTVVSLPVETYSRPAPINMTNPSSDKGWTLMCRSLLLPVDIKAPVGPKVFIWGEPVLRRYLTVYDFAKKRVGFSVARQSDAPSGEVHSIGAPPEGSLLAGAPLRPRENRTSPEVAVV